MHGTLNIKKYTELVRCHIIVASSFRPVHFWSMKEYLEYFLEGVKAAVT